MKLIFVLLTIHLILTPVLRAQKACASNQLIEQAEIYYRQKTNLSEAIALYKAGFNLNLTNGSKVLDAITAATLINDTLSTVQFIQYSISIGISPSDIRNLWPHLGSGMDLHYLFSKIDTTYLLNAYQSKLDTSLLHQLEILSANDQKFRNMDDFDWASQRQLDSVNWITLKEIVLRKGGLPKYEEIGLNGQSNIETLFYHMDKAAIEWFMPYITKADNSNLGHVVLYQLDRIGMDEGIIYSISSQHTIYEIGHRTKMKNGYYCQNFGEWFDENSPIDQKVYETPIDPKISMAEVDRVRSLFCMGTIEQKRKRKPWVNVVSVSDFERLVKE